MAKVKIDVAVDAAAFTAFFDVFQQYRQAADDLPNQWKSIGKSTSDAKKNFAEAAASVKELSDNMSAVLKNASNLDKTTSSTSRWFGSMARNTRDVAKNITEATTALLKWAGITTIISGLTGYGALYGMNTLAGSVASNRSDAFGLNTSYGGLQSFRTNMQRFVDPDTFLGRIAEAQQDVSKRNSLKLLGIGDQDIDKGESDDVGSRAILAFKDMVDRMDNATLQNQLHARGLDNLFSLDEARRIKATPRQEVEAQFNAERRDRNTLSVGGDVAKKWQDFSTQLSRAEGEIESVFVTGLVRIEPGLLELSQSFTKLVQTMLQENGPIEHWLDELNTGIQWLAEHVGKKDFQDGVVSFIESIGEMTKKMVGWAESIEKFFHWLAGLVGGTDEKRDIPPPPEGFTDDFTAGGGSGTGIHRKGQDAGNVDPSGFTGATGKWWTAEHVKHAVDRLMKEGGLSRAGAEGLVARWAAVEAAGGPTSRNPHGGALGIGQWLGSRQKGFTSDFDSQLSHAIDEGKSSESAAWKRLREAKTAREGAIGASSYERAEGYNPRTGTDFYTGKSMAAADRIHKLAIEGDGGDAPPITVHPKSTNSTVVKVQSNTGGVPSISQAKAAAPP